MNPFSQVTRAGRLRQISRLARANLYDFQLLLRESWLVLIAFAILAGITSTYLAFFYPETGGSSRPQGLPEALYETLTLMTLQSDLDFPRGDLIGELIFFLTPLLGLALIFQSVLNFGRLLLDKGSRREAWQVALASTYRDHIIVCGLGRVGLRIVTQLHAAGYETVVVERDWNSEFVPRVLSLGVPVVLGDAREATILQQAGVMRARAVIAAINDDLLNVEIALGARGVRSDVRVVLRVFNEELDRNLERALGPNSAFSASAIAAPTCAAAAVSREIDYALTVGRAQLGVAQIVVQRESNLSGFVRAIEDETYVRILHHVSQEGRVIRYQSLSQLSAGDRITVIGTFERIEAMRQRNTPLSKLAFLTAERPVRPTERYHTVIVCGLGKIGFRVVRQLHALNPRPRIVVVRLGTNDRPEFVQQIRQLEGVADVIGDARNLEVLCRAGLDEAYSIAALTSDDLQNVQIALTARRQRPDVHIVLRTFSDALAERLAEMFGIHTTYSTSALAASTMAAAALAGDVSQALVVGGRLFAVDQTHLSTKHPFVGMRIDDLREYSTALVLELQRDGRTILLPDLDVRLQAGDQATLLAPIETIHHIRGIGVRG
ncbi:potassium channel family protein [Roseiflexus castenholzii]|uniref:potassium channel family protein n=1 Tax=Roseiflexus castenholzii TaxID=120962 RepID=UPI003C7C2294